MYSVADRFRFIQVIEIWILGTVNVSREKQVSVIPKFRLRQVSLLDCRYNTWLPDIYDLFVRNLFLSMFNDSVLDGLRSGTEEKGNLQYSEKKPNPIATLFTTIPHGLAWDRIRVCAVRGRRLTA
jgi:hypothetical protein